MCKKPVFCEDCKYFNEKNPGPAGAYIPINRICTHPNNIGYTNDWCRRKRYYKNKPSEINKNNDCPWFKPTWYIKLKKFFDKLV